MIDGRMDDENSKANNSHAVGEKMNKNDVNKIDASPFTARMNTVNRKPSFAGELLSF